MPTDQTSTLDEVLQLFHRHGQSQYGGESVSQLEHALQAACFAERAHARPSLIAAALLHDVGHLLHDLPEDAPDRGVDDHHESLAANWLRHRFGPNVVEPVRLHVAAKRYLCSIEPEYLRVLSPPSVLSLQLQGGPMTNDEVTEFRSNPFCDCAVALRRWDDAAKIPRMQTPTLEHFVTYLPSVLQINSQES
ncbi:MAG: HD domain-containing protein [Planctomycetes bacterium]|nr:HD domain-containing protein [Planctomycetota bacterium]